MRLSKPGQDFDEVLVPGERAAREAARRQVEGIPVGDEEWGQISEILQELGLAHLMGSVGRDE